MINLLLPLILRIGQILILSFAIYLAIRFFAYKRAFPLPRKYDFLWIINTLLILALALFSYPPFEINTKAFAWVSFTTFLLSAYLLIFVIDQFLVEHFLVSVLKIYVAPPLRKVIIMAVFAFAVLIGVQKIFNINPWAIYAPTSLLSLGIGIALKDTFQTFFAGVALSRIVHIGDWIRVGDKEGEVRDIDWARTLMRTRDWTYFFIPNSEFQKGTFQSFSHPGRTNRCEIKIGISYDAPPQAVKKVLRECTQSIEGILHQPMPQVLLTDYGDSAIQYRLYFWINDYSRIDEIRNEVCTRIWYACKREGIQIPFPIRTINLVRKSKEIPEEQKSEVLLSTIDLFKELSADLKQLILERLKKQTYLKSETVVRENEPGTSFYIVLNGHLEVLRHGKESGAKVIGELSSGQFFGELSLLTGEPRSATVRAVNDSELLCLEKKDFQKILEIHPELVEKFAEVVASRQAYRMEETTKEKMEEAPLVTKKTSLSHKIRNFFNLKTSS